MKLNRNIARCLIALAAVLIPVGARADSFSGTAVFSDTSAANNNDFNYTGKFASPSFSFTGGVGKVYKDALTITTKYVWNGPGPDAPNDQLSVSVNFTSPSVAQGQFSGTGESWTFFGILNGTDIDWTTNNVIVPFSDGSRVQLYLPNFSYGNVLCGEYGSDTEYLTMTVLPSAVTPEPSSILLLGTGLLCLIGLVMYRRSRQSTALPMGMAAL